MERATKASFWGLVFNYTNAIIGSGIIGKFLLFNYGKLTKILHFGVPGMPYTMRTTGPLLGILAILISGLLSHFSMLLIVKTGHLTNTNTYQVI